MESLNALLQGMGLMHLGAGQAIMLLVVVSSVGRAVDF